MNGVVGTDVWACVEEDYEEGKCGKLRRWLYGMRPAAMAWDDYAEKLESIGFLRGRPLKRCSTIRVERCVLSCTVTTSR